MIRIKKFKDNLTNTIHDLKAAAYNFTTTIGTFDNRFVLRYLNPNLGTNDLLASENDFIVSKNNNSILVQSLTMDLKEVQIFDIRGRLIIEKKDINTQKASFENLNIAQQILIVKIKTINNKIMTKKIVF